MATLFDDASLVMIPSGYKDDKLYSIKPTSGDGDFTFSRDGSGASPATRVNSAGLIEKGRTNLLLQSNTFNTSWSTYNASRTSGAADFEGGNNAWTLTKTGTYGDIGQTVSITGVLTFSVYAKAGTLSHLQLSNSASPFVGVMFDLANGTVASEANNIAAKITDIGSGWYRCEAVVKQNASGEWRLQPADGVGGVPNANLGDVIIYKAQLEKGLVATSYIETTTAAASAGILGDMPRLDYSGGATCPSLLLEPARTNLIEHSEYLGSWLTLNATATDNAATSPEGVTNAAALVDNATNGAHYLQSAVITHATGEDMMASVFLKKGTRSQARVRLSGGASDAYFNLDDGSVISENGCTATVEDYGNGWYRCAIFDTSAAFGSGRLQVMSAVNGNSTYVGDGTEAIYIYGAQYEHNSSYPTSYVPTYGSATARAADSCGVQDANLSTVIGQSEGVIFADLDFVDSTSTADHRFSVSSGSSQNWIFLSLENGDRLRYYIRTANTQRVDSVVTSQFTAGNRYKIAFRYDSGNNAVFINGAKVQDNSTTFTGPDSNLIRYNITGTSPDANNSQADILSKVKQSILFDTPLTDAECVSLTTI